MAHRIIILHIKDDQPAVTAARANSHDRALDEAEAQMTAVSSRVFRQVKSQMMRNMELPENLRELGDAQVMVLHLLKSKGKHMTTELAKLHHVTTPTMTRIVDGLVEKGYVERKPDVDDRRCIFLELTGEGREIGTFLDQSFRQAMRNFLSPLSEEQLVDIKRAHQHLASLIGEGNQDQQAARTPAAEAEAKEDTGLISTSR
jgi:DNA-binding MarR family transcriptional regulator